MFSLKLPRAALEAGWSEVAHEGACLLDEEIQAALPVGHRLKGAMIRTVARHDASGDVLCVVRVMPLRLAQLRLAAARSEGGSRAWPPTEVFECLDDWLDADLGDEGSAVSTRP